jgi:hypothetical protein
LPLVLAPGAGSELYRGIGAVLLGGLLVSTVVTLVFVPALLSLMMELRDSLVARLWPVTAPALPAQVEPATTRRPTAKEDQPAVRSTRA